MQNTITSILQNHGFPADLHSCDLSKDVLVEIFDDIQRFKNDPYAMKQWLCRQLTDAINEKLGTYDTITCVLPTDVHGLVLFFDHVQQYTIKKQDDE